MCACMYLASTKPIKNQPRVFQFLHTVSAQWASTRMGKMRVFEGLWLSVNGRLPDNYKQVYTQSCMSMTSMQNVGTVTIT